jgi:arylsulfatase A-like enzyme
MYLGQNGWYDKRFMYDVSMRTPLLVRWPGKTEAGTVRNTLVQNIDLAPTFLDIAGTNIPKWMQGLSLKSLSQNKADSLPRNTLYYHFYEVYADHRVLPHLGVRTDQYKLVYFYTVDEWELYDLKKDPQELQNVYFDNSYKDIAQRMRQQLDKTRNEYDDHGKAGVLK